MKDGSLNAGFLRRSCQGWSDIVVFDTIDSTSNWIKGQSQTNLVCLAEEQTAGRGRHGHEWQSPNVENIYLSFNWSYGVIPKRISLLSLWVGITIAEVLEKQGIKEHGIKWPNDLYWRQQKLGGILVEVSNLSSKMVVGVGLNVNMDKKAQIDQPWVGLSEIMQKTVDRGQLLISLLDSLYVAMVEFPHIDNDEFMRRWNHWDLIRGQHVSFSDKDHMLRGEAKGIDQSGYLKVLLESGEEKIFGTSISKVRWQ